MEPEAQTSSIPPGAAPVAPLESTALSTPGGRAAHAPARSQATARSGRTWAKVVPALVFLAAILTFVFQNLRDANVHFVTLSGRFPIGLALLAAAALGGLFVLVLASVQIYQLRRVVRRHEKGATRDRGGA